MQLGKEGFPRLVNPHALSAIVDAGATRVLLASRDIFDDRGTKLWARDKQISRELRERLLARTLAQPLETSLRFADGLDARELRAALQEMLDSGQVLAQVVAPWAADLLAAVDHLPLQPAAQLLMTTMVEARPKVYRHAVQAMALAGAMAARAAQPAEQVRLAMTGGLLHDMGELYVDPSYLDGSRRLDPAMYRHVVSHPRIGQMLLSSLTEYPPALARAVGEHHERLDGGGYPAQRVRHELSPLGRLLAVAETTLGVLSSPGVHCEQAGLALRVLPGEYDSEWVGFITSACERTRPLVAAQAPPPLDSLRLTVRQLDDCVTNLHAMASKLMLAAGPDWMRRVATRAAARLDRMRRGWNALGLWSFDHGDIQGEASSEHQMAVRELNFRLGTLRRDCLWPELGLTEEDGALLEPLWQLLPGSGNAN